MTKIKTRINEYKHEVADCPFCGHWCYVRAISKVSPDPLRDLKRHITNAAKTEALDYYINGEDVPIPHLQYFKSHTSVKPVVVSSAKRQYDSDLTI